MKLSKNKPPLPDSQSVDSVRLSQKMISEQTLQQMEGRSHDLPTWKEVQSIDGGAFAQEERMVEVHPGVPIFGHINPVISMISS